ncbi:MAG: DUF1385 domain-containing protein [Bacteroidota bacterium]
MNNNRNSTKGNGSAQPAFQYNPNKPLQVGGQAVIEGVMMRGPGRIATAVRRASGEIVVKIKEYTSLAERYSLLKLPVLRGAVGLIEMMFIGIDTLNFSSEIAFRDIEEAKNMNGNGKKEVKEKSNSNIKLAMTVILSLVLGVLIFFVMPLFVTTKFFNVEQDAFWFNLTAGGIRLSILVAYLFGISLLNDVKRLFEYHGAEHKAVFTFESHGELTVDSAKNFTRFHPRCGTSFILIVMLVSMILFSLLDSLMILWLGKLTLPVRLLTHLPSIPIVGGISYEFIRWSAKRSTSAVGKILVAPGLWLQRITTQEPNSSQIEVALVAIRCALGIDNTVPYTQIQRVSELAL